METTTLDPATMTWDDIKRVLAETAENMKETDRRMKETDRQMQETDRRMQETDQHIKKLENLFTTQWGKLVEALTKPAALKLFLDKGIHITHVFDGAHYGKYNEDAMEVDVILCNTTEAVAVEVKTTCKTHDVDYFMEKMKQFKTIFHQFKEYTVYPAVAALQYDQFSDAYALKKGLFVLRATGEDIYSLTEPKRRAVF